MEQPIRGARLTKRYGQILALDALDIEVGRGQVYGLLGPNGAGKTTTLRILLGLVRPTAGTVSVLGRPPGNPTTLVRVGAMMEQPAFYPYLSGRDNLCLIARSAGVGENRVGEALATVGLAERAKTKAKTYSQGMRQRLALAAVLLKDPDLFLLDEPSTGLDPQGMAEVRALIRNLGTNGRTVLLSSHLLAEVEQICSHVGIIHRGRMVAGGAISDLRGEGRLVVVGEPLDVAYQVCQTLPGVTDVTLGDGRVEMALPPEHAPELNAALLRAGVRVKELRVSERSLEAVFLEVVKEAAPHGRPAAS
ncbi:TPA: ABC transporter ATP-binding protein [Candidatus Acetothermia bacterium]|nr:ABC transporter ATP-binding protein [Candidatus Acetothermia bacterium]HAZ30640.1 ABC transporter ATP-binding protein [Candidatus Acetothermia bacterium]